VKVPEEVNMREIRDELHLTRQEFADQYGFKRGTALSASHRLNADSKVYS